MLGRRGARKKAAAFDASHNGSAAFVEPITWPPAPEAEAVLVEVPADVAEEPAHALDAAAQPVVEGSGDLTPDASAALVQMHVQGELMRLLDAVTAMCDRVVAYVDADRAERRLMTETLEKLGRAITDSTAVTVEALQAAALAATERAPLGATGAPAPGPLGTGERVLGGSMPETMPSTSEPVDVREPENVIDLVAQAAPAEELAAPRRTDIAVEVRGRFGDRWVDGFEICEVMTTPDGPRYRLRRHRDGVVLPELFDATNIRHVETFDELRADEVNGAPGYWSRS